MMQTDIELRLRSALSQLAGRGAPTSAEIRDRIIGQQRDSDHGTMAPPFRLPHPTRARGALAVLVAAASVAAVMVGSGLVLGGHLGSRPTAPTTSSPSPSDAGGQTRVVGRGRAVITVPQGWATNAVHCGTPTSDTVAFEGPGARLCMVHTGPFDSVTVGSATLHPDPAGAVRTVDGESVYVAEPATTDGLTVIEVSAPEQDAWFRIATREADLARQIADSLRLLPANETTMPDILTGASGGLPGYSDVPDPAEVQRRLAAAHLRADIRYIAGADANHWASFAASAQPGTVLETGTTIVVTYATATASAPRPAPVTMETVRRVGAAQEFRPYTGPDPAPISEAEALKLAPGADDYSLGRWDIGIVHQDTTVTWHSVWIIAADTFYPDLNQVLTLGGRPPGGSNSSPQEPRPGWGRSVTVLDATTGDFVFGYSF